MPGGRRRPVSHRRSPLLRQTEHRFSAGAAGRSFRMRARVRPDAHYPFATGHSRVIRVRVL